MAGSELAEYIQRMASDWLPARSIVVEALEKRDQVHPSGQVIALERPCPWKEHLTELEKERGLDSEDKRILYVLYPESSPEGNWRIQCVPTRPEGFENRKSLPERYLKDGEKGEERYLLWVYSWRGHRDEELSQIAKVDGCIFVHASG